MVILSLENSFEKRWEQSVREFVVGAPRGSVNCKDRRAAKWEEEKPISRYVQGTFYGVAHLCLAVHTTGWAKSSCK